MGCCTSAQANEESASLINPREPSGLLTEDFAKKYESWAVEKETRSHRHPQPQLHSEHHVATSDYGGCAEGSPSRHAGFDDEFKNKFSAWQAQKGAR